jgi:hypothetical protein
MKVTAVAILLALVAISFAQSPDRLGDLFVADLKAPRRTGIQEQIDFGVAWLNRTGERAHRARLYSSQFGSIWMIIFARDAVVVQNFTQLGGYLRVVTGKLSVTQRQRHELSPRDGVMLPGDASYELKNIGTGITSFIVLIAPHTLSTESVEEFKKMNPVPVDTSSNSTLNLGRFLVHGSSEVNINQMATNLIARGERLVSAPIAINKGISVTMFVLRGISGCHRHMRSDYIAWNALGGSLQHIKFPLKFDSKLNDPAVMPWRFVHNLISHSGENEKDNVNVMILLQFPAQTSNDSESVTGCMEP